MKFIEIYDKVSSTLRSQISFRVNGDVQMVALVREERRDSSGSVRRVVVCELSERE